MKQKPISTYRAWAVGLAAEGLPSPYIGTGFSSPKLQSLPLTDPQSGTYVPSHYPSTLTAHGHPKHL